MGKWITIWNLNVINIYSAWSFLIHGNIVCNVTVQFCWQLVLARVSLTLSCPLQPRTADFITLEDRSAGVTSQMAMIVYYLIIIFSKDSTCSTTIVKRNNSVWKSILNLKSWYKLYFIVIIGGNRITLWSRESFLVVIIYWNHPQGPTLVSTDLAALRVHN